MKKFIYLSIYLLIYLSATQTVSAVSPFQNRQKNASEESQIKVRANRRARVNNQKITTIEGTTLTIGEYTVLTGTFDHCTTKFIRKFGGKSNLGEFAIGDEADVHGRWQNNDSSTKTIEACTARDRSIQKRFAVFIGIVAGKSDTGWTMTTLANSRPDQKIIINTNTQYFDRKMQPLKFDDIQNGHRVRVKGIWNTLTNTVAEVSQVKDFSLPIKVTPTIDEEMD